MYVKDLNFDGTSYTIRYFAEGTEIIKTYQYLIKCEEEMERPSARYTSSVRYVLTNEMVTWEEILHGWSSSVWEERIDFDIVYTDIVYKDVKTDTRY